jgi:beta-fructofuranosidase
MALKLPGQWVWDSWFVFDGQHHHAFYLQASRALGNPDRRHRNVTVGHAISTDLTNWTVVADAIAPSDQPGPDSWTTWTGSVVREPSGQWRMFYTGTSREDAGERQTVCAAVSHDLMTWTKVEQHPVVAADSRWYQTLAGGYSNEPFRDPWVFRLPGEAEWSMLTTASSINAAVGSQQGVAALSKSQDLIHWEVQPPISEPGQGFNENEVLQFEIVDGVPIVLFCCWVGNLSAERIASGEQGGVYSVVVPADLSSIDFRKAVQFPDSTLYASRLVRDADGGWNLIAFRNIVDGSFVGELCDPIPVTADAQHGLVVKENVKNHKI